MYTAMAGELLFTDFWIDPIGIADEKGMLG
jgi:hypothetical protein